MGLSPYYIVVGLHCTWKDITRTNSLSWSSEKKCTWLRALMFLWPYCVFQTIWIQGHCGEQCVLWKPVWCDSKFYACDCCQVQYLHMIHMIIQYALIFFSIWLDISFWHAILAQVSGKVVNKLDATVCMEVLKAITMFQVIRDLFYD